MIEPWPALAVGGVLGRHDPQKPRQLLGPEALPVADLGAQPGGRQRVDPAKAAQPRRSSAAWRLSGIDLLERGEQRGAAGDEHLDRRRGSRRTSPASTGRRSAGCAASACASASRSTRPGPAQVAAQQELRQRGGGRASDRRGSPRSRGSRRGTAHRRPSARTRSAARRRPAAGQALGVTLVGLDPITRRARDLARGHHPHVDPTLDRGARQPEPGRPSLIDRPHRTRQASPGTRRPPPAPSAASRRAARPVAMIKDRRVRLRRMHVKPDEGHTLRHGRHLPELGCRRQDHPAAQSPHISARGADRSTPQAGPDRPP